MFSSSPRFARDLLGSLIWMSDLIGGSLVDRVRQSVSSYYVLDEEGRRKPFITQSMKILNLLIGNSILSPE
jgi:hypothetical protein